MSMTCSSSTDTCNNYPETIIAYKGTNIPIMDHISIDGLEEHTYVITITFKETGSNQDENQGRTLSGKIGILESDNYSSNEQIKGAKLVSINATYNNNEIHTQGQVINKDDLVVTATIMDEVSVTHNVKLNNDDYQINLQDNKVPNDASGTVPIKVTYNYNGTTKSNTFNVTTSGSDTYDYPSMMSWSKGSTANFHAYRKTITQIDFVNNVNTTDSTSVWDISADSSNRILAWLDKDNSSHLYIGSESNQIIMTDMSYMFYSLPALTTINFNNMIDTSNVTDMTAMLQWCTALTSLDLSFFDTSNVTNMYSAFADCYALTSLDLSNFDTSNVTNMSGIFTDCITLTSLDLSNFDTSNVTNMSFMFSACYALTTLDLSSFDTSKVGYMHYMFQGCSALTNLDLSSFTNTNTTTNMNYMFQICTSLKTIDLSGLTISDTTTNITDMFTGVTLNEQGSYAKNSTSAANLNTISNSNAFRVKS